MEKFNWDDYEPIAEDAFDWDSYEPIKDEEAMNWDQYKPVAENPAMETHSGAATTSMIRAGVPFASSIAGVSKTAMDAITGTKGPLAGGSLEDLVDDYRDTRDSFQRDADYARDKHPGTSFVASIPGSVVNPLFKGAKTLKDFSKAGAVHALGESDSDLTKGEIKKALQDTGGGALGGVAGKLAGTHIIEPLGAVAGKGLRKVGQGAKWVGKKLLTTLGPEEEAITARLNGKAQDSAKDYPELAKSMADDFNILNKQISDLEKKALSTLSPKKNIDRDVLTEKFYQMIRKMTMQGEKNPENLDPRVAIGGKDQSIVSFLRNFAKSIESLPERISEQDIKRIILKLDDNIDWSNDSSTKLNRILRSLRNAVDTDLKKGNHRFGLSGNEAYEKAMIPIARRMGVKETIQRRFNLKNDFDKGATPTDATAANIKSSLKENKRVTQNLLKDFEGFTGNNYHDLAHDYRNAQNFATGRGERSSARTNAFGLAGSALGAGLSKLVGAPVAPGGLLGGVVGGFTGKLLDRYGAPLTAKMIDGYIKSGKSGMLGKFSKALEAAADKGPQSLEVAVSILMSNPEFQKQMRSLMDHKE